MGCQSWVTNPDLPCISHQYRLRQTSLTTTSQSLNLADIFEFWFWLCPIATTRLHIHFPTTTSLSVAIEIKHCRQCRRTDINFGGTPLRPPRTSLVFAAITPKFGTDSCGRRGALLSTTPKLQSLSDIVTTSVRGQNSHNIQLIHWQGNKATVLKLPLVIGK